jgi:hypothetical protein
MTVDEEWEIFQAVYALSYFWSLKTLLEKE